MRNRCPTLLSGTIALLFTFSEPSKAQSALETAAYLINLYEPESSEKNEQMSMVESGSNLSITHTTNYSSTVMRYTIKQVSDCEYQIRSDEKNSATDRFSYDLDFSKLDPEAITTKRIANPFSFDPDGKTLIAYLPGVKSCKVGKGFINLILGTQDVGECRPYHAVVVYNERFLRRLTKAAKYMKEQYCSGRAF